MLSRVHSRVTRLVMSSRVACVRVLSCPGIVLGYPRIVLSRDNPGQLYTY